MTSEDLDGFDGNTETDDFHFSFSEGEGGRVGSAGEASDNVSRQDSAMSDASMTDMGEISSMMARVKEMEEEAEKIKELQSEVEKQMTTASSTSTPGVREDKPEVDARSVYVGNVDYSATAEELEQHFHGCGSINRVTIMCDKFKGTPKGFAYVEFSDKDSVGTALALDESLFKGRQIKVIQKRTNLPGISTTDRPPRGSFRGRRSRGGYRGRGAAMYNPYALSRGGAIRGGYRGRRPWSPSPYFPY